MQRGGRIKVPTYRIVVTEHTSAPKAGKEIEVVGTFDAAVGKPVLHNDRITYWLSVGAQPSDTVHNMLVSQKVIDGKKINVLPKNKNKKVAEAPAA